MVTKIKKTPNGFTLKDGETTVSYLQANAYKVSMSDASDNRVIMILSSARFVNGSNQSYLSGIGNDRYFLDASNVKVNEAEFSGTQEDLIDLLENEVFNA